MSTSARIAYFALATAVVICALSVLRAVRLDATPRAIPPVLPALPKAAARLATAESAMGFGLVKDPFSAGELTVTVPPAVNPRAASAKASPTVLVGTVVLPDGGMALIESQSGSRVVRVGQSWQGMVLREIGAGQAVFIDPLTGEETVLRIRKAGT